MKKTLVFFGAAIAMVAASQIPARAGAQTAQQQGAAQTQPQTAPPAGGRQAGPPSMGGGTCVPNPVPNETARGSAYNCPDAPNPLPKADTVWLEEMTWMDVRDAMKAGKTTVIISTGGM